MSKVSEKKYEKERQMRDLLLALDGKMMVADTEALMDLLRLYEPCPSGFERYMKPELVIKSMVEDWLVAVSVDENNLLRVRDISTRNDWQGERRDILTEKCIKAFYPKNTQEYMALHYGKVDVEEW